MRQARWWLSLAACLLLHVGGWAQQGPSGPSSYEMAVARADANILRVNGRPLVLTWARGLSDPADLDQYVAAGFNTAYVVVEDPSEAALAAMSELLSAADERSLLLVVAVAATAVRDSAGDVISPDPTSEIYRAAVTALVDGLAERFQSLRGLIGWSLESVPPDGLIWNDASFRLYLSDWYDDSLVWLNDSWGTAFSQWEEVSLGSVRDIDAVLPAGIGRASVDYAYYRQAIYADALSIWARALHASDPDRAVFASSLPDYRSIIGVPTDFDGLILNVYPTVAEADWQTHNVHAVDVARRANQFAVIPTFWVETGGDARRVASWMNEALLHGAAGLALSSWTAVRASDDLQALTRQARDLVEVTEDFPAQPVARAAILYEPIAGGATRNGQGLYGYLDGVTPAEPTGLFAVARRGSRYGQFDVLAADSIGEVDLGQYGAIFAPMALYLSEAAQTALHGFVLRGGTLVVDAGVGMYQGDGTINSMPPALSELLGMRYTEVAAAAEPSQFGSLGEPGQTGQPGIAVPVGPGEAGLAIDPDVARFAEILNQFLTRPDVRNYLGAEFVGDEGPGFRVRGLGSGYTIYAPTFLYASWSAGDPYFNEFHDRVLSWRHDLEVIEPGGLWPAVGAAAYADWRIGLASPTGSAAIVDIYGARNQLYHVPLGAVRVGNPAQEGRVELLFPGETLAVARPLPIYVGTSDEGAVVTASVVRYDASGIELLVYGTGSEARVTGDGIQVTGGGVTNIEIEVGSGAYPVERGSMHRVVIEEGIRARRQEQVFLPNPETGAIVIAAPMRAARVTIEPAPEQ